VLVVAVAIAVHQNWTYLDSGIMLSGTLLPHAGSFNTYFFVCV
jgi:hypothetical protein